MELIREFPSTNVHSLFNWYLENDPEFQEDYETATARYIISPLEFIPVE